MIIRLKKDQNPAEIILMSLIVLLKQKKALGGLALDGRARPTGAADEVVQVSTTQKLDVVVQDLS